ncbi:MAG: aminotransferase class I/II-fold pyridoxal phosphate-dependent enzyme [Bacillota bacterium]
MAPSQDRPADLVRLNANESPYDLPEAIKDEILEAARNLPFNRYDPGLTDGLRRQLAAYADPRSPGRVTAENVVLGNGSDEIILLVNEVFAGPGGRTVIVSPSFEMYHITAARIGAETARFELESGRAAGAGTSFALDVDGLVRACHDASIVFICRPNNPTGTVAPEEAIHRLLAETPAVVAGRRCLPPTWPTRFDGAASWCGLTPTSRRWPITSGSTPAGPMKAMPS